MVNVHPVVQKSLFFALAGVSLLPFVSAPIALVIGFLMVTIVGNPFPKQSSKVVKKLLQFAIVGLGFGMNFFSAVNAGKEGMFLTVITIVLVLVLGWIVGRALKLNQKTSYLLSSGTAICGGSAIAAIAPIIKVKENQISVAIGTVFVLNAIALLVFPLLGNWMGLSQHDFGLWSAVAIHDTSSVVGAASQYGEEALEVATTVKLGRALWIIPLSLFTVFLFKGSERKIKFPYFILFFIAAMLISTFTPEWKEGYSYIVVFSKRALVLTLFLVGAGLTKETIKKAGSKSLILGVTLWIAVSVVSLGIITLF